MNMAFGLPRYFVTAGAGLVFPPVCPACRGTLAKSRDLPCTACALQLQPFPEPRCPGCGGVIDGVLELCAECIHRGGHAWEHAVSVFPFQGLARELVHRYKYQGDTGLAPLLARRMLESWEKYGGGCRIDAVTPVPLHWIRGLIRGYNQAQLLAEIIARRLGVPQACLLRRCRHTRQQTTLGLKRRQKNMHRVFAVTQQEKIEGRSILLVDDVLTTGATLDAAATALRQAGAGKVYILTIARG